MPLKLRTSPLFKIIESAGRLLPILIVCLCFAGPGLPMARASTDLPVPILAQTTSPAPAAAPSTVTIDTKTGELPSLSKLFGTSPVVNSFIAILSVMSVSLFVYLLMTINAATMMPRDFIDEVTKLIVEKKYDDAARLCRSRRNVFIASIIQRLVENVDKDHSVILSMIDAEGRRRADILWNKLSYLADLSNVSPMFGLVGTVLGIIQAFMLMPHESASISSKLLTESIGGALSATMFGLCVAILSLFFYSIIKARITSTLSEVEQTVHSIADHVKRGSPQ